VNLVIDVQSVTKRYGRATALDDLSFRVEPGLVTGFLGPNGAGKTTTFRVILGLARPTSGQALVNGHRFIEARQPLREAGALLDATAVQGGRTALDHLGCLARTHRIPRSRVVALLERVGLAGVAHRRVGAFSLGMKQRLGIAAALLGDPGVLLFDEPVNGMDPDGVRWIRELLGSLAAEGRTVLVSSHLISEMELTAHRLVIVGRGRLIANTSVRELADRFGRGVRVRSPRVDELRTALERAGATAVAEDGGLSVYGMDAPAIAGVAAGRGIPLHEVTPRRASLEEAYMELTAASVEHRALSAEAAP
jgi:ABC-2 type transport system ATP-binding protein